MRKALPFIFFLLLIQLFTSCTGKKPAIGNEDDIIVIADSSEYYELEPSLIQVFEKVIYTPQPENLFQLIRKDYNQINQFKRRKNIIILGSLDSNSSGSNYLNSILDSNVISLVQTNEEYVINKYDLWAKNQLVMFLVSPSVSQLEANILEGHENLLYSFRQISDTRLYNSLYNATYERKDVEAELLDDYGWIIYVQADFQVAKSVAEDNFVWIRRGANTNMERWLFVHWVENASMDYMTQDSLAAIRNRLTQKYYRTSDEKTFVEISYGMSEPIVTVTNFNKRYALMSQGFWRFDDKSGGGPFISYSFLDENTNRFYMVDGSIFAPKYYKKKLIQQVDVTLRSFKTRAELSEDQIEELYDNLEED